MLYLGSYVISIEALLEVFYYNRYNNYILPIHNAISLDVLVFVELSPPIISKRECHPVFLAAKPGWGIPDPLLSSAELPPCSHPSLPSSGEHEDE